MQKVNRYVKPQNIEKVKNYLIGVSIKKLKMDLIGKKQKYMRKIAHVIRKDIVRSSLFFMVLLHLSDFSVIRKFTKHRIIVERNIGSNFLVNKKHEYYN